MLFPTELLEIAEAIEPDIDLDDNPDLWDPRTFCEAADAVLVGRGWPAYPYEGGSIEEYLWARFSPPSFRDLILLLSLHDIDEPDDDADELDAQLAQLGEDFVREWSA